MSYGLKGDRLWVSGLAVHFVEVEFFGEFGFHVFVIVVDDGHVGIEVAGGVEDGVESASLFLEVLETENDRDIGAVSDDVETFLPFVDLLTRGFRADDKKHFVIFAEHVNHLFDEVVLLAAVNGNATKFAECPTQYGSVEELLFHHDFEVETLRPEESPADEKVFNGSVRCDDADALFDVIWYGVDGFPAANP